MLLMLYSIIQYTVYFNNLHTKKGQRYKLLKNMLNPKPVFLARSLHIITFFCRWHRFFRNKCSKMDKLGNFSKILTFVLQKITQNITEMLKIRTVFYSILQYFQGCVDNNTILIDIGKGHYSAKCTERSFFCLLNATRFLQNLPAPTLFCCNLNL